MSGRPRGRTRGRPKGSGRGRGRGQACQTEEFSHRSSGSPPPLSSSKPGEGRSFNGSIHGFPLSTHPGAPPGSYPYRVPLGLQPPGLPLPPSQGIPMPRSSSHTKFVHSDDDSPCRVSSGTQSSMQSPHCGFSGSRHSHDAVYSRQMSSSGSRQVAESSYSRQGAEHVFIEHHHSADQQERATARKSHRTPRNFPFQQEFEPTYTGHREKKFYSSGGQRSDKDSFTYSRQSSSDKISMSKYQPKDTTQRVQFQNAEPSYQRQKREQSLGDQRHERDVECTGRRVERDQSYDCPRLERDPRYAGPRHERDQFQVSSRREREPSFGPPMQRSGSLESNHSFGSQYNDRDTSPHFSQSPVAGYRHQAMQLSGRDLRNHSVERDFEFSKHRESSIERYSSHQIAQCSVLPRKSSEAFSESPSRFQQRDTMFNPSVHNMDTHVQFKNNCSTKQVKPANKSSKSAGSHQCCVQIDCGMAASQCSHSFSPSPELCSPQIALTPEPQRYHRLPGETPRKQTDVPPENRIRNCSSERSSYAHPERGRPRKKQSAPPRDRSTDVLCPSPVSYCKEDLPPTLPRQSRNCASGTSSSPVARPREPKDNAHSYVLDEKYGRFRTPGEQPPERRYARPERPTTPFSQPPSPQSSRPPTPPLYSPRTSSPSSFSSVPSKQARLNRQQSPLPDDSPTLRHSSPLAKGLASECSSGVNTKNAQTSPSLPQPQQSDSNAKCTEPPSSSDSMAWQQQYLKHLQQQQQQLHDKQSPEGSPQQQSQLAGEFGSPEDNLRREQFYRESLKNTGEHMLQEQLRQEQMRRQQEQMQREFIKIQLEKMQQEHARHQAQLRQEHLKQQEQLQISHMRQQQEPAQPGHRKHQPHIQMEMFIREREKLQLEQFKQQEKMRTEQMKLQEHLMREHAKLQQQHDQQVNPQIQDKMPLPGYDQQGLVHAHSRPLQFVQKAVQEKEQLGVYQPQLPDYIKQRYEQIQQQQRPYSIQTSQPQQSQTLSSLHNQYYQEQLKPNNPNQQLQIQQPSLYQAHNSAPKPQQPTLQSELTPSQQQPLKQQVNTYQQSSSMQGRVSRDQTPVPPWRQGLTERLDSVHIPPASELARQGIQMTQPASRSAQGMQTLPPSVQHPQNGQGNTPARQSDQSPIRQSMVSQHGSPVPIPVTPMNYSMMRPQQPVLTSVAQQYRVANEPNTLQAPYQGQYQEVQGSRLMNQTPPTFNAQTPPQMVRPSGQQIHTPKKPPWLRDRDTQGQMLPWQHKIHQATVVSGQDTRANGTFQFPVPITSSAGLRLPAHQQNLQMPQMTHRAAANSVQQAHGEVYRSLTHPHTVSSPHQHQNMSFETSKPIYSNGLHVKTSQAQTNVRGTTVFQNTWPHATGPLHAVSAVGQPRVVDPQAVIAQSHPGNVRMYQPEIPASIPVAIPPGFHSLQQAQRPAGVAFQYPIPNKHARDRQSAPTTDQECAAQVLTEALNDQVQKTHLEVTDAGGAIDLSQSSRTREEFSTAVHGQTQDSFIESVSNPQQQLSMKTSDSETYTLHHLFDDSNKVEPHTVMPPVQLADSGAEPVTLLHQPPPEMTHEVVPGNALDTAVAMLNLPDSVIDLPMIEQHQVFVLDRPGTDPNNRQQPQSLTASTATGVRRNSWHTPENSIAGSRSASSADDDAALVIDLGTELGDDDDGDDVFSSTQPPTLLPVLPSVTAEPVQYTDDVSAGTADGNDLGLRISSVFSLAIKQKKKRRTMSDSVLQEVEVVSRQDASGSGGFADTQLVKGSNSLEHLSLGPQDSMFGESGFDFAVSEDQKGLYILDDMPGFNSSASDPLAELTKLIFSDMPVSSPATMAVEDWNLKEATGVSFEADSVCVPGTPLRGDPERLAYPMPQLCTPCPGTPRPNYFKDPGTPFARHVPVAQYIKNPATPLPSCARESWEPSTPQPATPFSNYSTSDIRGPHTPLPKVFKEDDRQLSSCAMGPPAPFRKTSTKSRDLCQPLPLFAEGYAGTICSKNLSEESQRDRNSDSDTTHPVFETGVQAFEKTVCDSMERPSKQPLEQAIRELLGDEPIEEFSETLFEKITDEQVRDSRTVHATRSPRKSERIAVRETSRSHTTDVVPAAKESEQDTRSRVIDNWEKRCAHKNPTASALTLSKQRHTSRVPGKGYYSIEPSSESTHSRRTSGNMPALIHCPVSKAVEEDEEEKKSCGVRGRRMKTVAGKRRQRLCSTEEASPDHAHNMATDYCSETEGPQRILSHDSTDSEHERKTSYNADPVETKTHCDDDLENDVFFPELSPTNSTDSSLVEGDDGTGRRGKRRRLSSCDSRSSSLSCQSCVIESGETMADMILPTIFPPSRRRSRNINSSTEGITHCLATFHEHKLRCVELEGEQYVLLEELLAKCFPGLPRDEVEIARLRDLNLLTKTVHLLGSGLAGDNGDSVSVLALSDAARLLHFFHGMMHCPGTDCLLRASPKARTDSRDSEPSPSQTHDSEERASVALHRAESSGFAITGKADNGSRRYSNQSEEGGSGENEGPEDTHSCSSDRTFPYCDGQPMTSWEEESPAKTENSTSDSEHDFSPITTTHSVSLKFRRHFSDSEGRAQKLRDHDGPHRGYHQSSPDVFSPDEVSAMLPPLPTYIASPFTPNSMYNVPMDNERVLLECFSAPGSQAPSSVRSAPSVRLPSPDHHDLPHLDEDVFEGLANYKLVADHDTTLAKEYFHSKQIVTPVLATKGVEVEKLEDHIIDNKSGVDVTERKDSIDNHYYDFADDYDLAEFEETFADASIKSTGDIDHSRMFEHKQENLDIVPKVAVSEKSLDTQKTCARFKKYSKEASYTPCKTVCENYGTKTAIAFPSSLAERQLLQKHEIESLKEKLNLRKVREKEAQMAKDLGHKLNSVIASRRETSELEDDKYEDSLVNLKAPFSPKSKTQIHPKPEPSDNDDRSSLANSARSSVSDDSLLEVSPNSPKSSSGTVKTFCEDPALVIQRKSSGTTIAYGASDDEAEDVLSTETSEENSATGGSTQALLHSQNSTGPPELSTAQGSVQTNNSPNTSPPRIEPITIDTSFTFPEKAADSKSGNVEQETDEIRLPSGCEGSLEDRVQDFIAQGSQFTPRPVKRSNSLPDLCGAETLASPVRDCEEIPTYSPGAITSRTRSYPGASDLTKQQHSGRWDDQSSAPSPVALPPTRLSASVEVFGEEQDSSKPAETPAASTPPRANERTDFTDTDAPALETEEAVFVDPTDVVDVVEVSTRATPQRIPQVAGDCEDQFFEWAVPCAAHGSVFCSCECVDVQTVSEVAASPKVGPWLCTPGTPAPGTPFCDYSKLIYSPFPVEAGMTPARPDTADAPVGSPKLTPKTVTCGVKRQAPSGGQPSPKRRSLSPSAPSGEAGKSCDDDRVEIRTNGADFKDSYEKDTESDSLHKEGLLLRSAELELITAAEESEKDMAVVPDEDKVHPQTLPDDIYECTENNNAGVRLSKETEEKDSCWDRTDETMHNALLSAAEKSEEHLSAVSDGSLSRLKTYTITDAATNASDTAQLLSPPHTLNSSDTSACEKGRDKSSQPGVDTDNSDRLGAEVSANLNADPHDESSLYSSEQHSLSISKPFDQAQTEIEHMEVPSIKDETDSASAHADCEGARQPSEDTNTVDSLNDMGKPSTRKANHKLSPNAPASPDAPSVGTAESETTDDERIISLGEFMESDMEITSLEDPEDSRDSTKSRLSPKPSPEPELERSTLSKSKKTLTIAQYRARRRQNQSNSDSSSSEEPKEFKTIDSNADLLVRSDSQNQTQQEEQSDSECSEKAAPEVSSKLNPTSPESMLSASLPLIDGVFSPKMRRTESVPAEPSRRPTVHLKRSSSFHGQHPASKRFRQEEDDTTDLPRFREHRETRLLWQMPFSGLESMGGLPRRSRSTDGTQSTSLYRSYSDACGITTTDDKKTVDKKQDTTAKGDSKDNNERKRERMEGYYERKGEQVQKGDKDKIAEDFAKQGKKSQKLEEFEGSKKSGEDKEIKPDEPAVNGLSESQRSSLLFCPERMEVMEATEHSLYSLTAILTNTMVSTTPADLSCDDFSEPTEYDPKHALFSEKTFHERKQKVDEKVSSDHETSAQAQRLLIPTAGDKAPCPTETDNKLSTEENINMFSVEERIAPSGEEHTVIAECQEPASTPIQIGQEFAPKQHQQISVPTVDAHEVILCTQDQMQCIAQNVLTAAYEDRVVAPAIPSDDETNSSPVDVPIPDTKEQQELSVSVSAQEESDQKLCKQVFTSAINVKVYDKGQEIQTLATQEYQQQHSLEHERIQTPTPDERLAGGEQESQKSFEGSEKMAGRMLQHRENVSVTTQYERDLLDKKGYQTPTKAKDEHLLTREQEQVMLSLTQDDQTLDAHSEKLSATEADDLLPPQAIAGVKIFAIQAKLPCSYSSEQTEDGTQVAMVLDDIITACCKKKDVSAKALTCDRETSAQNEHVWTPTNHGEACNAVQGKIILDKEQSMEISTLSRDDEMLRIEQNEQTISHNKDTETAAFDDTTPTRSVLPEPERTTPAHTPKTNEQQKLSFSVPKRGTSNQELGGQVLNSANDENIPESAPRVQIPSAKETHSTAVSTGPAEHEMTLTSAENQHILHTEQPSQMSSSESIESLQVSILQQCEIIPDTTQNGGLLIQKKDQRTPTKEENQQLVPTGEGPQMVTTATDEQTLLTQKQHKLAKRQDNSLATQANPGLVTLADNTTSDPARKGRIRGENSVDSRRLNDGKCLATTYSSVEINPGQEQPMLTSAQGEHLSAHDHENQVSSSTQHMETSPQTAADEPMVIPSPDEGSTESKKKVLFEGTLMQSNRVSVIQNEAILSRSSTPTLDEHNDIDLELDIEQQPLRSDVSLPALSGHTVPTTLRLPMLCITEHNNRAQPRESINPARERDGAVELNQCTTSASVEAARSKQDMETFDEWQCSSSPKTSDSVTQHDSNKEDSLPTSDQSATIPHKDNTMSRNVTNGSRKGGVTDDTTVPDQLRDTVIASDVTKASRKGGVTDDTTVPDQLRDTVIATDVTKASRKGGVTDNTTVPDQLRNNVIASDVTNALGREGGTTDTTVPDQLAVLLKEKERMLEEFRKRAMELERTVEDLRVELKVTKKKGEEAGDTQSSW